MTWHEGDVVAEWPEPLADRLQQLLVIAAREVRAADRAPEQHVAHEGHLRRSVHERHVARRVAGAMRDVEGQIAEIYRLAALQPALWHERLVGRKVVFAAGGGQ